MLCKRHGLYALHIFQLQSSNGHHITAFAQLKFSEVDSIKVSQQRVCKNYYPMSYSWVQLGKSHFC